MTPLLLKKSWDKNTNSLILSQNYSVNFNSSEAPKLSSFDKLLEFEQEISTEQINFFHNKWRLYWKNVSIIHFDNIKYFLKIW